MTYNPHPGSLGYQLGMSLSAIRKNVEQEDLPGIQNHLRLLKAQCLPKMSKEFRERYQAIEVEADDWGNQFELEMRRLEILLQAMTAVNVYAWTEQEIQDATGLALDGV